MIRLITTIIFILTFIKVEKECQKHNRKCIIFTYYNIDKIERLMLYFCWYIGLFIPCLIMPIVGIIVNIVFLITIKDLSKKGMYKIEDEWNEHFNQNNVKKQHVRESVDKFINENR